SNPTYINSAGYQLLPHIDGSPQIIQIDFNTPVVIPAGIERILVEVRKSEDFYNPNSAEVFIAGTEEDNDFSWYKGCGGLYIHTSTNVLNVPNANFYINVIGEIFNTSNSGSTTTLTHNFCDDIVQTMHHSCYSSYTYFGRDFYLEDFGISTNEEFVINSGQVGISYSSWGATVQFNVYKIDDNFPDSFSETDLIGSSQEYQFPYMGELVRILDIDFETPIMIPADVTRILVEVKKGLSGDVSGLAHFAGTTQDDGASSWYKGCVAGPNYINTDDLTLYPLWPGEDYNLYINVTGETIHTTNNFAMNISNICSEFLKEFSVENKSNIASVIWDFGDPDSGVDNTSTDLSPFHDFSADGTYTITAIVTANDGSVEVLTETINVKEPPNAYGINNLESCEDTFGTGISTSFNISNIQSQVLGGQTDRVVTYIDGSGNEYDLLPNPFTNTVKDRETITVRVARSEELCCYSETTFDLIVNPLPVLTNIPDLTSCENNTDGFANFDLSDVESIVLGGQTGMTVEFYDGNVNQLSNPLPNPFINSIPNQEIITVRVINDTTDCYNETTFTLNVNELPVANPLDTLIGCDDNNDGISEYFDITNIESQVLDSQTGMEISYFDSLGNILPNPLPNPFTNTEPYIQNITVRVTNSQTSCYSETILTLETATQPNINQPDNLFACDEGNGFAHFDTSDIEAILIASQVGLEIFYFDESGNALPSPLPSSFLNTTSYNQTISVRVENILNRLCYSEASFNLIVNELPEISLEDEYLICNLNPSLTLSVASDYYSYSWYYNNTELISETYEAILIEEGNYTLVVSKLMNGITCENSFTFHLTRSILPSILDVKYDELGNNFIEIIASGDGDFEYSIDGINYQDSNYFGNIPGGIYTVYIRDKDGCGEDSTEVAIVDYPKFFTPNNDGYNDNWQIKGLNAQLRQSSKILIFDRYGKLLKQLDSFSKGWDGTFNGALMPTNDYWFTVDLNDGRSFRGHFTLKR
ncbi:T9SS type B sorting domain-containing protein, partial [Flavobacteriaceae bacterium AH-315-B10]|nr:T9SS type B sorting domain-containing protein [Flavobacteriaceae bacterium AH-315-B10]